MNLTAEKRQIALLAAGVFIFASAVALAAGFKMGISRPVESDAHYFLQAAQSLADGKGFMIRDTFWPDQPAMSRSPGWPWIVSIGLRMAPGISPDVIMRTLGFAAHAASAALVFLLAYALFQRKWVAVAAGFVYAVHPVGLYLAYGGDSESLFVLLSLGGVLLLLRGGFQWQHVRGMALSLSGAIVLGLSCLVRPNFVLFIAFLALLLGLRFVRKPAHSSFSASNSDTPIHPYRNNACRLLLSALCALLFILPSLLWAGRNYKITGHFPVLSTLRGQTFYGGNNEVVAIRGQYWGYWIFPNQIPGEKPMSDLARDMSEYEVDRYYYGRGLSFIRQHLVEMPGLLVGKLVRAYLPIPWKITAASAAVSAFRCLLYLTALVGMWMIWKSTDSIYKTIFLAVVLTNIATVMIFWGCARFAFPLDAFLMPFAVAWICPKSCRAPACPVAGI